MNKVIMIILDGFGVGKNYDGNAISLANMNCYSELLDLYPHTELYTTGENVETPEDKRIDCEVSHLILGAGKVVPQDITICNDNLSSTLIEQNEKLLELLEYLKDSDGNLHLVGMVSDGQVYSDIRYMKHFITHLKNVGVKKLYFHAITDGRDVPDQTANNYLTDLDACMKENGLGKIATICGRTYAMDRDDNYKNTKAFIDLLTLGKGAKVSNYEKAIETCYKKGVGDAMIPPIIIDEKAIIQPGDVMIWLNFREDRARQTLGALCNEGFDKFKVKKLSGLKVASVLPIDEVDNLIYLIDKDEAEYSIGQYLSLLGLKQARITEEDKASNLTYYFNGSSDKRLKGLDNFIIPSYKREEVINHPEMNIEGITRQAIKCIEHEYDFIVVNIEAPDIFGHIGDINKAIESLKIVDENLEKICEACDDNFYKLIITSDHGNVEEMINEDGTPNKGHTANPVPFIIRDKNVVLKSKGYITQVAGTILKYMDIAIPKEMKDAGILFKED